jgi:hypothetical protein
MKNFEGNGFVFKRITLSNDVPILTKNNVYNKPIVYNVSIAPTSWTEPNHIGVVVIKNPTKISNNIMKGNGTFYDLQPLSDSIVQGYYFGAYIGDNASCNPPSFLDRIEGKLCLNEEYFNKAKEIQKELNISDGSYYYPIGLITFINPADIWKNHPTLRNMVNEKVMKNQSCVDYQFFSPETIPGEKVYGLDIAEWYDDNLPFRLDQTVSRIILKDQGTRDLLTG